MNQKREKSSLILCAQLMVLYYKEQICLAHK